MEKTCKKCKLTFPEREFRKITPQGDRASECRTCFNSYLREYNKKNKHREEEERKERLEKALKPNDIISMLESNNIKYKLSDRFIVFYIEGDKYNFDMKEGEVSSDMNIRKPYYKKLLTKEVLEKIIESYD